MCVRMCVCECACACVCVHAHVCVCVCVTCTWLVGLQAQGRSDHACGAAHSCEDAGLCVFEEHFLTVGAPSPPGSPHLISLCSPLGSESQASAQPGWSRQLCWHAHPWHMNNTCEHLSPWKCSSLVDREKNHYFYFYDS